MNNRKPIPADAKKTLRRLFPDSEAVFAKAAAIMILKAGRCLCDVPVGSYYVRIPDTYQLKCTRCKIVVSPLSVTPLSRDHKELTDTIDLVCRFYYNRRASSPIEIAQLYKCKYETARRKAKRVTDWMELALRNSDNPIVPKHINDNKIIRVFSERHHDFTTAINSLFDSLPSLRVAMKANSNN